MMIMFMNQNKITEIGLNECGLKINPITIIGIIMDKEN